MATPSPLDSEAAIREVARGYELTTRLNSLLRLAPKGDSRSELAAHLSQELLQALSMALSILRSVKPSDAATSPPPAAAAVDEVSSACLGGHGRKAPSEKAKIPAAGDRKQPNRRERRNQDSWTTTTCAPHVDGYQWRKYGEKKINNAKFPRWYYRCTHKDDRGCTATKQVQQKDTNDPPMFQVTYINQHTCRSKSLLISPQLEVASSPYKPCFLSFGSEPKGTKQDQALFPTFLSAKRDREGEIVSRRSGICLSLNHSPSPDVSSTESTATSPSLEGLDTACSMREPKLNGTHHCNS